MRAAALVLLLGCNAVDAFGTLHALAHGAEELNPLMAALIAVSPEAFLAWKLIAVSLSMVVASRWAPAWALAPLVGAYVVIAGLQWRFA